MIKVCPFEIKSIQTDHGFEFTYKYYWKSRDVSKVHPLEKFCNDNQIRHRLIIPGEKELQGLVERCHRQDDQEFYFRMEPMALDEFNSNLRNYCHFRNAQRRFKKLDWKTPNEWLASCSGSSATEKIDHIIDIVPLNSNSKKDIEIKELGENDDIDTTKIAA